MKKGLLWDLLTVVPASAGVILNHLITFTQRKSSPRKRGGDPKKAHSSGAKKR